MSGDIKAVVTDIEGTTSSISFVHDVLFPYARRRIGDFVRSHSEDAEVAPLLNDVRREAGRALTLDEIVQQLCQWIDEDKKITPLKALQGLIWEEGYRRGDFTGHVYPDAYDNLRRWKEQGIDLYVFSSGSVKAQKLIFGYSDFGDMTPLFSGYFDTNIGAKREAQAYRKIIAAIDKPAHEILFLSDIVEELDAAQAAGMATIQLVREGELDENGRHRQVRDFNAISLS